MASLQRAVLAENWDLQFAEPEIGSYDSGEDGHPARVEELGARLASQTGNVLTRLSYRHFFQGQAKFLGGDSVNQIRSDPFPSERIYIRSSSAVCGALFRSLPKVGICPR
jgi:hypothetical protein